MSSDRGGGGRTSSPERGLHLTLTLALALTLPLAIALTRTRTLSSGPNPGPFPDQESGLHLTSKRRQADARADAADSKPAERGPASPRHVRPRPSPSP